MRESRCPGVQVIVLLALFIVSLDLDVDDSLRVVIASVTQYLPW